MTITMPREWIKLVRAKSPTILEVGKPAPKAVLSFGGAGFLVTYSLGVALYLQQEKKSLVSHSFMLGAGTGALPAVALACGPQQVSIDKVRDFILDNLFCVSNNEPKRIAVTKQGLEKLLPPSALQAVNGRLALTIGFSNRDPGYMNQAKENIYFGHHIAHWDNREDFCDCIVASMAPDTTKQMKYRDAPNVMRGTMMSMSSELDQYCRHVHVHGYSGYKYNKNQTRHNFFFGRHGFLANTHFSLTKQAWMAFAPNWISPEARREDLKEAFDHGYNDARRYERWEEDPYHFAKPDRSPGDNFNVKTLRAAFFGSRDENSFQL